VVLITILIAIAVIVVLLLIIVAMQPGTFRVERSTSIAAPAATVFGNVNDFRRWKPWSPWENIDKDLQ
jgi:hypothetical protein